MYALFPYFIPVSHVTGIACGNGTLSQGIYHGVMPHARIVSIKILDRKGQGNSLQAIRALRWVRENHRRYHIRVVNLSVGTHDRRVNPALKDAAESLWKAGIIVVAAAGNPDEKNGTLPPPPISSGVISVGTWEDRSSFSAPSFSRFTKDPPSLPDLWAHGDDIISVLSPDYDFSLPGRSRQNLVSRHYIRMSGTSMATPFVSGAAALLAERYPRARPDDVRNMLLKLAEPTQGLLTEESLQEFLSR